MRYIGVDLHTNSFTACILQAGKEEVMQTWPLQEGGLERFVATLRTEDEVAVEATGNSAYFRREVSPHVKRVVVIAPWQFEVIRRSVKKTDRHDARSIAFFLSKDMLPEARRKSEEQTQLASLIARHGCKVKRETLTSRAGFARHVAGREWSALEKVELDVIAGQLDALRDSVKTLDREITAAAKTLPGYANLISIKGIGPLSTAVMLAHIGEIADFQDTGKLAAYFGIVPRVRQSNASLSTGRITRRGSTIARTALVQCTLVAKRYSPYLHSFYEQVKARRGTGKAIIATARKLLNTIFHTLKNNWVFQDFPNFKLLPCNQS